MTVPGDPNPQLVNVSANPEQLSGEDRTTPVKAPDIRDKADVQVAPDKWSDQLALRIVTSDFSRYEKFRSQHYDQRWTDNDRILHANIDQGVWEGTQTPRASVSVRLEQQQLESILPYLDEGLFQSVDGIFFDCFPRPNTSADAANATREHLAAQLDMARVRWVLNNVCRSLCHHGTGVLKVGWCQYQTDRAEWRPQSQFVNTLRGMVGLPPKMKRVKVQDYVNRPELFAKNLRDIYVDRSLKMADLQLSQSLIERAMLSYDELIRLGEQDKSYNIPSEDELRAYLVKVGSKSKTANADSYRQTSLIEAGQTTIHTQGTTDPAKARFEILEYWSQDRFVVVLERGAIPGYPTICNKVNPYGFIPYFSCNFVDVIDAFYGKGMAELLEYEQMLQAGLVNSHLDEVSLSIHSGIVVQSGSVLNKSQLRPKPGWVIEASSPEAVREIQRTPVTQDWIIALQQSQIRAQQIVGLSDAITQGTPSVATSMTRTARGVGALQAGSMNRIQYLIERIEDRLIVPMLDAVLRMNQMFLKPDDVLPILGKDGIQKLINPIAITNGQFSFELRAASRMAARSAMQQSFPAILQGLGMFMEPMMEQGVKTNVAAIMRDYLEVNGFRNRNDWFSPMTADEIKARQQQQTNPIVLKGQIQSQRDQARFDNQGQRQEIQAGLDMLKDVTKQALEGKPVAAHALGMALDASQAGDA